MFKIISVLLCIVFLWVTSCHKQEEDHPVLPTTNQPSDTLTVADCIKCIVITDQAEPAVDIVDAARNGKTIGSWSAFQSNIAAVNVKWFSNPDEAKPVYNLKYLLINASGGGVALVRIKDGKAVFYAYAGKNPHSSELLPDGNIVTASSTDSRLVIFHVDTTVPPNKVYKKIISMSFAHNVVWDKKRKVLWAAGDDHLYKLQYNFNCKKPNLIKKDSFPLSGNNAHDLFPVYGKDSLWLTNPGGVYYVNMQTKKVTPVNFKYTKNLKSVSSGPGNWPTIIMKPKTKWWSDMVLDSEGDTVFQQSGMEIYKARWFLKNSFSYPDNDKMKVCN